MALLLGNAHGAFCSCTFLHNARRASTMHACGAYCFCLLLYNAYGVYCSCIILHDAWRAYTMHACKPAALAYSFTMRTEPAALAQNVRICLPLTITNFAPPCTAGSPYTPPSDQDTMIAPPQEQN
eukprot:1155364-Pelagomonas_calceolata.AAC.3